MSVWTRDYMASHCRQKLRMCNLVMKSVSVEFIDDHQYNLNLTYDNNFLITSIYLVI